MTYQDVIETVGEFGLYQKRLCALLFMSTMTCALGTLTMLFTMDAPKHRCNIPFVDDPTVNTSTDVNKTLAIEELIPHTDDHTVLSPHMCKHQQYDVIEESGIIVGYQLLANTTLSACQNGYIYFEDRYSTAFQEFGIMCGKSYYRPVILSLYFVGEALGSFGGGHLSDRFGRRRMLLIAKTIEFTTYFVISMLPAIEVFVGANAFSGIFVYMPYVVAFVLGNELMGLNYRNAVSLAVYGGYCFGATITPVVGYLIPNWRWLMKFVGSLGLLYIPLFYWLIPESPYWLLSSGNYKDAHKELKRISKLNGKKVLSLDEIKELYEQNEKKEKSEQALITQETKGEKATIFTLIKSPIFRRRITVAWLSWICTNMVYYGLALHVHTLSGDRVVNAVISGALEYPGILTGFFIIGTSFGRVRSLSLLMGFGGVCLAVSPFIESVSPGAMTVLVLIGKTALISSFYINFSVAGEMSPTLVRNAVVGSCSAVGKFGSITAPYLLYLGDITTKFVPYLIMGGLAMTSACLSLFNLPETKGQQLPDSMEEAENLKTPDVMPCRKRRSAQQTVEKELMPL